MMRDDDFKLLRGFAECECRVDFPTENGTIL